jgi:hypothetical protein
MSSDASRKFISPREGARQLDIPIGDIYRARKRGTILAAEGPDVPKELCFEESEFLRWAAQREKLRKQGRPRGAP